MFTVLRTPNQAIRWEIMRHWKWLVTFSVLANTLPLFILGALSPFGLPPNSKEFVLLFVTLVPFMIFLLGLGYQTAIGRSTRLNLLPISTTTIANWHYWVGAVWTSLLTFASISVLNSIFNLNWPSATSSLFAFTSWCLIQTTLCFHKRFLVRFISTSICLAGLMVMFSYMNNLIGRGIAPAYWQTIQLAEGVALVSLSACLYFIFRISIQNERVGSHIPDFQPRNSILTRVLEIEWTAPLAIGSTPSNALTWMEWKHKGLLYSMLVGVVALLFSVVMIPNLIEEKASNEELIEHFLSLSTFWLSLAAVPAGLFMGSTGTLKAVSQEKSSERIDLLDSFRGENSSSMNTFLRTLPIANSTIAKVYLTNLAWSHFLGIAVWLIVTITPLVLFDWTLMTGLTFSKNFALLASIIVLVPWTVALNLAAITALGNAKVFAVSCYAITALLIIASFQNPPLIAGGLGLFFTGYLALQFRAFRETLAENTDHGIVVGTRFGTAILSMTMIGGALTLLTYQQGWTYILLIWMIVFLAILPIHTFAGFIRLNRHG